MGKNFEQLYDDLIQAIPEDTPVDELICTHFAAIRARYGISQSDLCLLLGWGAKTVTRYESHQVQDIAHDTILRKLDSAPEWFLRLLHAGKESLSAVSYAKYLETGNF